MLEVVNVDDVEVVVIVVEDDVVVDEVVVVAGSVTGSLMHPEAKRMRTASRIVL